MPNHESIDFLKKLIKQLELDQDYLLLTLHHAIQDENEKERNYCLKELKRIHEELKNCHKLIKKIDDDFNNKKKK